MPQRKRRREASVSRDPAVVRARILDAAQVEFMTHGYLAASTNRISRAFGGSKATLFRHFSTKIGLLEAVVQRIAAEWRGAVDWRGIDSPEPAEWLTVFAHRVLVWILRDEPLFIGRLAITEGERLPHLKSLFHATAGRPLQVVLARQLRIWTKQGRTDVPDPRHTALHFLDLLVAGQVSRRLYGEPAQSERRLRAHVASAVALFLNGCGTHRKSFA